MKLTYRILWVEDQPENVDGARKSLEFKLSQQGFRLRVDWAINIIDINKHIEELRKYHEYDLILVDYQLGSDIFGDSITKKIRNATKTDLVFYSSSPPAELRRLIFDQGVDGVFSVNRNNIGRDVSEIIMDNIYRSLDLNHMRGIMMSSVSDIDHIIGDCLRIHYDKSDNETQDKLTQKIKGKILDASNSGIKNCERLNSLEELLGSYHCSTNIRYNSLQSILKTSSLEDIEEFRAILDLYKEEVIDLRNDLAHGRLVESAGAFVLDGKEIEISAETFRVARTALMKHLDNFENIRKALAQLGSAKTDPES